MTHCGLVSVLYASQPVDTYSR